MPKVIIRQTAPTPCNPVDIDINGTIEGSVASGGTADINIVNQDTNPVTISSVGVVGDVYTVNITEPRNVFVKGLFSATNDTMEQLTIDADSAGTYTIITDDGGSGTIALEVNGSPATLPFTLTIGDTLDAQRTIDTNAGFFKLTGTYV